MKVVVVIKKGVGGSGVSQAARYISTRERNEDREGSEARQLFSESQERLSYSEANRLLGDGHNPKTDDVLHLVISFHHEEDFNQLGSDEESRLAGVRETTRSTLNEVSDALNAENLRWVAGIHRNTDNPHVHLLIHREYIDRQTGHTKRLNTLPKQMRVSWQKAPDGTRIINPGLFSQTFEKHFDRNIQRFQEGENRKDQEVRADRITLGRAMVAQEHVEQLRESLQAALTFGEWRRFRVADGQGRSRLVSERDLRGRADANAERSLARVSISPPFEAVVQMRREAAAQQIGRYSGVIQEIRAARGADLSAIELKLQQAAVASQPLIGRARAIREKYKTAGLAVPPPILSRGDLAHLQERAVARGDAVKLVKLEEIRAVLAAENGEPTRKDLEMGRLRALLFLASSRLKVAQQSAARFEEAKHLRQWEVDGEGRTKSSLAGVDAALAFASDQAKFIGARKLHWDDDGREKARERADELSRQRAEILDRIAGERAKHSEELARRAEVVRALDGIFAKEKERYCKEKRELPPRLFFEQDWRELDAHAARLHDPHFYRTLVAMEREFDARSHRDPKEAVRDRFGRARARQVMAAIELQESESRLERFNMQRERMTVILKENGGPEIFLGRLADVEPKSPLEHLFRPLLTRSEKYRSVSRAVSAYEEKLRQQHEQNKATHVVLSDVVRGYEQEFVRLNPGQALPRPQFTARELSRLEQHAIREADPARRERYAGLYDDAMEESHWETSRAILLSPEQIKEILDLSDYSPTRADDGHVEEMSFER